MPVSINREQFEKLVSEPSKINELRVKRIEKGRHRGHMKLKLRTPKRLYTLYLKDPGVAKLLVKNASKTNINVVRYKKGKRV